MTLKKHVLFAPQAERQINEILFFFIPIPDRSQFLDDEYFFQSMMTL
jgi:hypothetical protein